MWVYIYIYKNVFMHVFACMNLPQIAILQFQDRMDLSLAELNVTCLRLSLLVSEYVCMYVCIYACVCVCMLEWI